MAEASAGAPPRDESARETRDDRSDQELLERFRAQHDEAAFTELVRRHGKTVWAVCRRFLQQQQDAEDAFQAVFLVLARKAAAIRKGEAVGSWLYGVACRVALRARQQALRRQQLEPPSTPAPPEPWQEAACRELQRLLDDEVQRLAEKYRAPFVLCCLQGLSKAEAARALGWKEGTVSGRLAQARQLLQKRLARRGIALSAVLTAGAVAQNAAAAPPVLLQATVHAALTGKAATLAPAASLLADGVLQGMAAAKLKMLLALLLLPLLAAGALLSALQLGPEMPADPETFVPPPALFVGPVDETVMAVAFSPDGQRLVTAGGLWNQPAGQLKVWDVATGKEQLALRGIPPTRTAVFSPDGKALITGDFSGAIRLRDADTGAERARAPGYINNVALAPDGKTFATSGLDKVIRLWDLDGLRLRQELAGQASKVFSVAFFHDGQTLASASEDKTAKIWDLRTGKERFTLRGHRSGVDVVAVSPGDKLVATGSWDQTIKLWNAETGQELASLEGHEGSVLALSFSPDGKLLASGAGKSPSTGPSAVRLWDVASAKLAAKLPGHTGAIWHVAFSPDGTVLASGSADKTARLWDVAAQKPLATLVTAAPPRKPVRALAYAPDGKLVALSMEDDRTIELHDAQTGALRHVLMSHTDVVTCLAFAPDGRSLASGSQDRTVKLWDLATNQSTDSLQGHGGTIYALAFSPDGKTLASAGYDRAVQLWDLAAGKPLARLEGHQAAVRSLAFAPHGRHLASGSADQTIRVWNIASATATILKGHAGTVRAVVYTNAGTVASAAEDGTVKLWDLAQAGERETLRGHTSDLWALAISPGGRLLVSGGQDKTVRIWDAATGQARGILHGHKDAITALAIHPQGKDLLSGSLDTAVLRWPAGDKEALAAAQAIPPDNPKAAAASPEGAPETAPRRGSLWLLLALASFVALLAGGLWLRRRRGAGADVW